jgi:P pilus assembly chaperone PapD
MNIRIKTESFWSTATVLLVLGLMFVSNTRADMLISPTRAALDTENNRQTELVLRNTSDGLRTYRLSWEDKRVIDTKGTYKPIADGENWPSAAGMIRFSPRQITVGPGENQTVRLSLRPPADLEPGEYRSHLRLQVVAEESEPSGVMEMEDPNREGVAFKLFMQMSFSIPVVVRHQIGVPEVAISNIKVVPAEGDDRRMSLEVELTRTGEASSYGEIVVEMQKDRNSPVERIGRKKGVYLFHETGRKIVNVPLRDQRVPPQSYIRVAYEGIDEYKGKLWDEKIFQSE